MSLRALAKNSASTSQTTPENTVSTVSTRAKSSFTRRYPSPRRGPLGRASLRIGLQHGQEGLLRDLHPANLLHPLLALLLLLEELLLAGGVAAVALGQHVLAHRLDRGARDDLGADRGLDGHVEHLPRDQLAHLLAQLATAPVGV